MRILSREVPLHEGEEIELAGWVEVRRDHGKLIFVDLRDRTGLVQLVAVPGSEAHKDADRMRGEWVVKVRGLVRRRPKGMENPHIETGNFEVELKTVEILNEAETPPFPIDTEGYDIDENVRLRYRYVDLRRKRLQQNIKLRHEVAAFVRAYLSERGFLEIETPLLTKSTPEGSRDFIVPSRLQPGKFYALPQSPQQYKQLLMTAGFERYFQLARALRDEDLRADRSFEHTQIDLEMSFVEQKDVMTLVEGLLVALFERFGKKITKKPFPVFSYREALKRFGADKFDMRKDKTDKHEVAFAWVKDFPVFMRDEKTGKLTYSHNPFTAPRQEDVKKLLDGEDLENIVSLQYDLVANGYEIGGGGIRIHKAEVLEKVFAVLGYSKEEIKEQFGHMLEAFRMGTPPHGGIALGFDRIIMILSGEEALREVVPFPMTSGGQTAVMDAPSEVSEEQLKELNLEIKKKKK